ncbi:MAG: redox-sensing transcriptional repressor Rex [Candidatus Hydrogenedentota bacterium]|nr:MAG: redox-sensing transcriptional repressor Rex [Candidatus Hydrogenedentota bacterium]
MVRKRRNKISYSTVRRLTLYLRELEGLLEEGQKTVSSRELAAAAGVKATQLRKDLSFFGSFGVRGRGYDAEDLADNIRRILGVNKEWPTVLVGAGSLGHALAGYKGFALHNIRFVGVLDSDPAKIGTTLAGLTIEPLERIWDYPKEKGGKIVVLAVPASAAQDVADMAIRAGYDGIINFAPVRLRVPPVVALYSVDLSMAFEHVTFELSTEN